MSVALLSSKLPVLWLIQLLFNNREPDQFIVLFTFSNPGRIADFQFCHLQPNSNKK